ncbi:hypothetical protein SPBR_02142 [Sporothrix brasiliensis 5110]|uniref:Uncharacterized protein n=1 Tax=Sporothrix brasiliensis 5110 TaxID=1398154 RepID=A0A0C2IQZ3_9PEZI|nr:uncharacterized protein SPBR_02142 [Sporothrix brasiliensis 5110]KIH91436.1 hypothetical protein SPBR_02142 [Sporothrix brasiliensis 5110]
MWRTLGPVWEEDEDVAETEPITQMTETGGIGQTNETHAMDGGLCNDEPSGDADADGVHGQHISIEMWQREVECYQAHEREHEMEREHLSSSPSCFI